MVVIIVARSASPSPTSIATIKSTKSPHLRASRGPRVLMLVKERTGVLVWDASPLDRIRLLEEILHVALLLLGGTFPLIRAPLALLAPVPAQGAARFLHSSLGLVHSPFVLVSPAALRTHSSFSSP